MITIIGGGPAGIGMGVLLKQNGIDDFIIIERIKLVQHSFNGLKKQGLSHHLLLLMVLVI